MPPASPAHGYSVRQIGVGCGAVGTRAMAVYNNRAFWAGDNAFYAYDGTQISVIECPLKDRYVGKLALIRRTRPTPGPISNTVKSGFTMLTADDGHRDHALPAFCLHRTEQSLVVSAPSTEPALRRPSSINKPIAIDTTGAIWTHETGTAMPGNIVLPFIETGYLVGQAGDRWAGCRRYYPDIEHQVGNINSPSPASARRRGRTTRRPLGHCC